jgi:hypothetical protein
MHYSPVGAPTCPSCSRAYSYLSCRWRVACPRCRETSCRACFSGHCSSFLCVPLPLAVFRFGVCDGCFPDADLEARFTASFAPQLAAGSLVVRLVPPLFGGAPERQPCFLSLSASKRALLWRTLELVRQEPKEAGEVPLAALSRVERGGALGAGAAGDEVGLRLLGGGGGGGATAGKGARTLLCFSVRGERAAALWEGGCAMLPQLARARNSGVFAAEAPAAAEPAAEGAPAAPAQAPLAPLAGAVREANKAARDAFREQLRAGGPVTMEFSARALAARSPGEARKKQGGGAGAAAAQGAAGGGLGRSLGSQLASAAALARGASGSGAAAATSPAAPPPSLRDAVAEAGDAVKRGLSRFQAGLGAFLARR